MLLLLTVSMLYDEAGQELGKVLVFDDMSVVVSVQRAAAWAEVARRIAHEIKNPLTPISLAAQRLQRKFGDRVTDPAFKECTTMIVDQVDGLKNLVNEFSQFARMPKIQPVLADLNRAVQEAVQLFAQGLHDYKIDFQGADNLPEFSFDVDQIKRAVTNLVDNAAESVKTQPGGHIQVTLQYDPALRIAQISVMDNGSGIPPYLRARLFEPYMTTKNNGTGLGLAIVKRTVEDHNGYVRAFDNKPRGTRFVVELPVVITNTASTIIPKFEDSTGGVSS